MPRSFTLLYPPAGGRHQGYPFPCTFTRRRPPSRRRRLAGLTEPRIVAVSPGPPLAPETFSGTSRALLSQLEARGALAGAVDGRPALLARLEQAASFSPDQVRWRHAYNAGSSPLSPAIRRAMGAWSGRRAAAHLAEANALLQLAGWYSPQLPPGARVLRCAYHDGNLAVFLRRPDLRIDRGSRRVRRALDFERRLAASTDLVLPMSEFLRRSFIEDFGKDPDSVVAVGAGANVSVPASVPERDFARPRLLFVGRQFERKGGPVVVRAFAQLRERRPDAELWIAGPAGLRLHAAGVHTLGPVPRQAPDGNDVRRLYAGATMFVMAPVFEPFGIAFLEAMANRLPCIGSGVGAIPEMVLDGVTGHVVAPGDADALAARMIALAEDPSAARRLGEAGFARFRERYTWERVADRILAEIALRLG